MKINKETFWVVFSIVGLLIVVASYFGFEMKTINETIIFGLMMAIFGNMHQNE